jgi:hypothetical protein
LSSLGACALFYLAARQLPARGAQHAPQTDACGYGGGHGLAGSPAAMLCEHWL